MNLQPLPGNGIAHGINDSWGYGVVKKTVVGMSKEQAAKWDSTGAVVALSPGVWSEAYGVNSSGQTVGTVVRSGLGHAGLWQNPAIGAGGRGAPNLTEYDEASPP